MISTGVKTDASDRLITEKYVEDHIKIGIESLRLIERGGSSVKHLQF
jgi:AMP nucleosidase